MWLTAADGTQRLEAKLRADLADLAALKAAILDAEPTPTVAAGVVASE